MLAKFLSRGLCLVGLAILMSLLFSTIPAANAQTPPVARDAFYEVEFERYTNLGVMVEGYFDTIVVATQPTKGMVYPPNLDSIPYLPSLDSVGEDSFTYYVENSFGRSNVATITISIVPPPAPVTRSAEFDTVAGYWTFIQLSDYVDGLHADEAVILSHPTQGSLIEYGNSGFGYVSAENAVGNDSFSFQFSGPGGTSNVSTITLKFPPVPPLSFDTTVLPTGQFGSAYSFQIPVSGGAGEYTFNIADGTLPEGLTLSVDGTISGTSTKSTFEGLLTVGITVSDSAGTTETAYFTIAINAIAPTLANGTLDVPFGGQADIDLTPLAAGEFWSSGPEFEIVTRPANGDVELNGSTVTYVSNGGFSGTDSFSVRVFGPGGWSPPAAISVSVAAPEAPIAADAALTAVYGQAASLDLAPSITGEFLAVEIVSPPSKGTASISGTVLTFTPAAGAAGADSLTWKAVGTSGDSNIATVAITIGEPTLTLPSISLSGKIGEEFSQAISASGGSEPYGYVVVDGSLPDGILLNGDTLTGILTKAGDFSFTLQATDQGGFSVTRGYVFEVSDDELTATDFSLDVAFNGNATSIDLADYITGAFDSITISTPSKGSAILNGSVLSYKPNSDAHGSDSFTFTAKNTAGEATATVSINIGTPAAPTVGNASIEVEFNGKPVSVKLDELAAGTFDRFEILKQPEKGKATLNGFAATFTPAKDAFGDDSFTYRAIGIGGASSPATVSISIKGGELPVAKDHFVLLDPTQAGSVDLTTGATGSPFLKAQITGSVARSTGQVSLSGTNLTYRPDKAFDGLASISYQLENRFGISNVAKVEFVVSPRPDPSKDPEVIGLLTAQDAAAKQFAADQINNINSRLETLHNEVGERTSSVNVRVGLSSETRDEDEDNSSNGVSISKAVRSTSPWAIWSSGYVTLSEFDNDGANIKSVAIGTTAGIDYRFSPSLVGGVAVGYGRSSSEVGSNGTETAGEAYSVAAYASWHPQGGAYVDGIIGYQKLSFDSRRYVTPNGEFAYGSRDGSQIFGSITAGYEFRKDGFVVAPYVGVRASHGTLNGFSESGGGIYGLTYGSQQVTSLSGVVGIRIEKEIERSWGTLTPTAKIEYKHDFAGSSSVSMGYTDIGTMPYSAEIRGRSKDSVTVGVGVRAKIKKAPGWTLEGTLSSTFDGGKPSATIGVRATYKFCGLFIPEWKCGVQPAKTKPNSIRRTTLVGRKKVRTPR